MKSLGLSLEQAKGVLPSRADVFGITMSSLTVKPAALIARWVKRLFPDSLVVVGGPHPTFADEDVLKSVPEVDVVVRGEGELTALELVQRFAEGEALEGVKGITYRGREGIVRNEDRELIEDLDSLPFPAYHLLPVQNYRSFGAKEPTFTVLTSRGCPFNCKFCVAWKMNRRRYRVRSVKNVVEELEYLVHRFKARFLSFVDDLFTISKERVKALCRAIRERSLSLVWGCETRVDMVDRETLLEMRKAGCYWIYFGLESASQSILNSMRKGIRVEQIKRAFNLKPLNNLARG
ncbi:MAG: radical SAM protein [Candidatus Nezhaarchaeales archaeon]